MVLAPGGGVLAKRMKITPNHQYQTHIQITKIIKIKKK
jgi:hypothetical protein